jgi:Putative zinc-binding metallo-peptidase
MEAAEPKEKPTSTKVDESPPDLSNLNDEDLLGMRICDLKLKISGTELESRIEKFYAELTAKNISFKPICYLGDEWFCPEGSATIAIPFYLAHPRLKKLEEKMMLEVEGGTEDWCMRLLRHEMGHVLNHTYLLEKDKPWQKLFGPTSLEYSESFRARPYSRRFVRHLEGYYAQSHPEEDFAETVAIWLTPDLDWRQQYKDWKALEKLEFVDALMGKLAGKPPLVFSKARMSEASRLRSRLALYYKRRRKIYAQDFPEFFDADLHKLFVNATAAPENERAATFLRRSRKQILNAVSEWTGEPKFTLNNLLRALTERCAELDLRLRGQSAGIEVTAFLATLAAHYRLTGKFKDS